MLYGKLADGGRLAYGSKKHYKDHQEKTMKSFNLLPENLETEAADRNGWRSACLRGISHLKKIDPNLGRLAGGGMREPKSWNEDPNLV